MRRPPQFAQVGDAGVAIVVAVLDETGAAVNISGADALEIKMLMPDQTTRDLAASLYSDGADGKLQFVTLPDTLVQAGEYKVQGVVTLSGVRKSTRQGGFWVYDNVDET